MAMTAGDRVFVDTNILVYATLQTAPLHLIAQQTIRDLQQAGAEIWISRQILRELLATVTRPQPFGQAIPMAVAAADLARLQSLFLIAEDGPAVTANLLSLCTAIPVGGKQVHDANIVATMQAHGIDKLLTHNTVDFARYQTLITVIPLV